MSLNPGRNVNRKPAGAPVLISEFKRGLKQSLLNRRPYYTPEWTSNSSGDAGLALVELFCSQFASIARRVNRLPEKAMTEFLRAAGIQAASPQPAGGIVEFRLAAFAPQSVSVAKGFQVGAAPATGEGDQVFYETQDNLLCIPGSLSGLAFEGIRGSQGLLAANDAGIPFQPLGTRPIVGDAFVLSIKVLPKARVHGSVSLGIFVADSAGDLFAVATDSSVEASSERVGLQWELVVGGTSTPMEVLSDETRSLTSSGIIQLRIPLVPNVLSQIDGVTHVQIRARLVYGQYRSAPSLSKVVLNAARILAVRTVRDEVLQPLDVRQGNAFRLSNSPVVPDSLQIYSLESSLAGDGLSDQPLEREWKRTDSLESAGPEDDVYELNPQSGLIRFGDGVHGAAMPLGFRNVIARRYEVCRGRESAVAKDEVKNLISSAPFVVGVSNPFPMSGGTAEESGSDAIKNGPARIRSRNRSVTTSDYAVLARAVPGASVARAFAISGYHPRFRKRLPGVVGVLVVSSLASVGPPKADELALQAVARHLSRTLAPQGIQIVAASPRYRVIRAEVGFIAAKDSDIGVTARQIEATLAQYLHPISGGNSGSGWPFGGTLVYPDLVNVLITPSDSNPNAPRAVTRIRFFVDGIPQPACQDIRLAQDELFWSDNHLAIPTDLEGAT